MLLAFLYVYAPCEAGFQIASNWFKVCSIAGPSAIRRQITLKSIVSFDHCCIHSRFWRYFLGGITASNFRSHPIVLFQPHKNRVLLLPPKQCISGLARGLQSPTFVVCYWISCICVRPSLSKRCELPFQVFSRMIGNPF